VQERKEVREREEGGLAGRGVMRVNFGKTIYENFGHKFFSHFLQRVFRSIEIIFRLTSILQQNKHLQMLKIFFKKYFTAKQTEP
jgi:hypothetical protein